MHARARAGQILHRRTGVRIETPLLVPAFSSKGFMLADGSSDVDRILRTAAEFVTSSCLVSAYDIYHGHIPEPQKLPVKPELIFVDSGGYEISHDSRRSPNKSVPGSATWNRSLLEGVIRAWPSEMAAAFVTYDDPLDRRPVLEQVDAAKAQIRQSPDQLHCFLLKPEKDTQATLRETLKNVLGYMEALRAFDIIGVTEHELGDSHLDRMVNIARLREALDDAGVPAPLHVFGSLDPVSACLYFISGAEVFDGLKWIRYAFSDGQCVFIRNHAVLEYGVHVRDSDVQLRVMSQNYYYLEKLQELMKDFRVKGDYSKLPHGERLLKPAYDSLERRLNRKGGE